MRVKRDKACEKLKSTRARMTFQEQEALPEILEELDRLKECTTVFEEQRREAEVEAHARDVDMGFVAADGGVGGVGRQTQQQRPPAAGMQQMPHAGGAEAAAVAPDPMAVMMHQMLVKMEQQAMGFQQAGVAPPRPPGVQQADQAARAPAHGPFPPMPPQMGGAPPTVGVAEALQAQQEAQEARRYAVVQRQADAIHEAQSREATMAEMTERVQREAMAAAAAAASAGPAPRTDYSVNVGCYDAKGTDEESDAGGCDPPASAENASGRDVGARRPRMLAYVASAHAASRTAHGGGGGASADGSEPDFGYTRVMHGADRLEDPYLVPPKKMSVTDNVDMSESPARC
ncbi:unnamed protein product [Prorocentrum cordatum]|uniref:Uncharacterized protein n=1 Tax=Prorocentrum cordatum TaxID=2364126 RepID=A0ABN9VVR8_9DINO|nr:unnamed protein product [Polarella glacialis]